MSTKGILTNPPTHALFHHALDPMMEENFLMESDFLLPKTDISLEDEELMDIQDLDHVYTSFSSSYGSSNDVEGSRILEFKDVELLPDLDIYKNPPTPHDTSNALFNSTSIEFFQEVPFLHAILDTPKNVSTDILEKTRLVPSKTAPSRAIFIEKEKFQPHIMIKKQHSCSFKSNVKSSVTKRKSKIRTTTKFCQYPNCPKHSQGGQFCIRHGGGKRCQYEGCTKSVQSNNRCKAHGGGPRCKSNGCTKSSQGGGFCRAHGGGKRCQYDGCTKGTQWGNYCARHGGSRQCAVEGCQRNSRGEGLCAAHGGGKRCVYPDCGRPARKSNKCSYHLKIEG